MKKYKIETVIALSRVFEVEADNDQEAIDAVDNKIDSEWSFDDWDFVSQEHSIKGIE